MFACKLPELLGVVGTAFPDVTRLVRAVSGVGALMSDFFGVSVRFLLDRLDKPPVAELSSCLEALDGGGNCGLVIFGRLPPVMNGCRRAACGLRRRSGSHTRHFEMKSANSSSSQRRTCCRVLEPGRRLRPFELTTGRGAPV